MSQENVEIARQLFSAVAQRDFGRLLDLTDPEVEWHSFFALGEEGGVYRGHSGLRRYVSDLNDAWEVVRPEIDGGVGAGEVVLLVGRVEYRGRGSGAGAEEKAGWVVKFRGGRVILFRAFREPELVLEAAGMSE
jgi:ketosteroid isomerase-like protein